MKTIRVALIAPTARLVRGTAASAEAARRPSRHPSTHPREGQDREGERHVRREHQDRFADRVGDDGSRGRLDRVEWPGHAKDVLEYRNRHEQRRGERDGESDEGEADRMGREAFVHG